MRFPHVFGRSGKPGGRKPQREPADPEATARLTAAQLTHMVERCDAAGLRVLAYLLEVARIEAEKAAEAPPTTRTDL